MITQIQKDGILDLIEEEKERLGSYRAVAKKCKVSEATISQVRTGNYLATGDDIYETIGIALGFDFEQEKNWNIAEDTTNFLSITQVLADAKNESMFIGISDKAGCGKTVAGNAFLQHNKKAGVFKINCRTWSGREFLTRIIKEIGAEMPKGYATANMMLDAIAETIAKIAYKKPMLIIDQANSLRPSAIRTLIYLFNDNEDILGLTILGTENLEHEIKRGVRLNKPGYDEVDSRFGRKYIHLTGYTLADGRKICKINGITDPAKQKELFYECEPKRKEVTTNDEKTRTIHVLEDIRRLKRLIKRTRLLQKRYA